MATVPWVAAEGEHGSELALEWIEVVQANHCLAQEGADAMLRYFVAANFWLLVGILLIIGSGDAGSFGPDTYRSFFGTGKIPKVLYSVIVVAVAGLAIGYFVLHYTTRPCSKEPGPTSIRPRE